jgi:hypothetical protein
MQQPGLTAAQKGQLAQAIMHRPASSGLPFGYRWKPDASWYRRQVAKSNLRREAERCAVSDARCAELNEAAA